MVALKEVDGEIIANLERKLQLETTSLPEKYRILFSLRNIKGERAHRAMLKGRLLNCRCYIA
jgi:deoxyhypusine monooxygenase